MIRKKKDNHILKYRQLFHQIYCRYGWKKSKQKVDNHLFESDQTLKSTFISEMQLYITVTQLTTNSGRSTILPYSYAGSSRHMYEYIEMQLRMFVTTGSQIYLLHSNTIQLGMICNTSYLLGNRQETILHHITCYQREVGLW